MEAEIGKSKQGQITIHPELGPFSLKMSFKIYPSQFL